MRLYLLPISTRRTLLYCQRAPTALEKQTLVDKIQSKAARIWDGGEKKEGGWQKKVVEYGNYAFRRIPYEEWGLKSVPPLSTARRNDEVDGKTKVEVVYPYKLIRGDKVPVILNALSTERESLHRRRLIWCFVGMPFTAPIALIPVIPNLPFFYLMYRAWSHWRALAGGRHIQFLLQKSLLTLTPSPILDQVYANQEPPLPSTPEPTTTADADKTNEKNDPRVIDIKHLNPEAARESHHPEGETMLLSQENGRRMTQALDLPQLEVELERAIWQVETAIRRQNGDEMASAESPPTSPSDTQPPPTSAKSTADLSSNGTAKPNEKKTQ